MPLNTKGRAASLFCCLVCLSCAPDATLRGRFYWGHEVRSFQPCGSNKAYWVRADENTLQPLRERAEKLRAQQGEPYRPVYVEAVGEIDLNSTRDGFARNYDGLLNLRGVTRVSDAVPKECR